MATTIDYALMAGASYRDTRPDINKFPIPAGWNMVSRNPQDNATGFEAATFGNGTTLANSTEIVISFAGTYDNPLNPFTNSDLQADIGLALGNGSDQLVQAVDYYLQVKAANPNVTITLTGHSLGGGLASLVGVFFGVPATTFDQAPFAKSAQSGFPPDVAANLRQYLQSETFTADVPDVAAARAAARDAMVHQLDSFLAQRQANGGIPNSNLVNNIRMDGELLSVLPIGIYDTINGSPTTVLTHAPTSAASTDLHSQALLTAFLQSDATAAMTATGQKQSLSQVTYKLTDLLGMIFDKNLYRFDTDKLDENFIDRLARHEAGNAPLPGGGTVSADAMVTRFTQDLWKLAQDGGLTLNDQNGQSYTYSNWNNVSKALTVFAMQFYYEDTANATNASKQLFTDLSAASTGSNGVQFDMHDVSKEIAAAMDVNAQVDLTKVKGYQYFLNYLDTTALLSSEERTLIKSLLPYMRDWYVQAGASGMNATDTLNRGAFMLGGNGSDTLVGGTGSDLLVGNAGDDLLQGGQGNDTLLGGTGNDTYVYQSANTTTGYAGDGLDTILDTGGQNTIAMDGNILAGGEQYGDTRVHKDANGHLYVQTDPNTFIIDGNVLIQNYGSGSTFSFTLSTNPIADSAATGLTLTGDFAPKDQDAAAAGVQLGYDNLGNLITDPNTTEPGRADWLNGDTGNDILIGKGGSDILYGASSDDRLYADAQIDAATAIANGNTHADLNAQGDWLSGGAGDDTLVGSDAQDVLMGGGGSDLLIGGAGNDDILGDGNYIAQSLNWTVTDTNGTRLFQPAVGETATADGAADVIYAGEGNDYVWAGAGNDVVFGEGGDDRLNSNEGNDIVLGGTGADTLWGGAGSDYLDGGEGIDQLQGGTGDDILIGGKENDTLYGDVGKDIYIFNRGDGRDTIYDTKADNNIFRFGAGISASDITLRLGSLMLDLGNGDEIHIGNFDQNDVFNSSSISSFEFADGSTLTTTDLLARGFDLDGMAGDDQIIGTNTTDRINGLGGNDTVVAGAGDDTLNGGTGSDMLQGGEGDDTYLVNPGDGQDELLDYNGTNNIVFGAGIGLADLALSATIGSDGKNALLIHTSTGDTLAIDGGLKNGSTNRFIFADGNTLSSDQLLSRARWSDLSPTEVAALESRYIEQQQANTMQSMGDGFVRQVDGTWYQTPQLSGGISLYDSQVSQTFAYGSKSSTVTGESWQFYGNSIRDVVLNFQQTTITSNDAVINVAQSQSFSDSYSQAGLQVAWTGSATPAYNEYSQSYRTGYLYQDGSVGLAYQPGATVVTGVLAENRATYVSQVASLYSDVASSLTPYTNGLSSFGQGSVPQVIPVAFQHLQLTANYQTVNVGPDNHTVYGGDVVNAGSGDNLIEGAGFVNAGTGNNMLNYNGAVYAGSGNNTIDHCRTVYAGSGNSSIFNSTLVYGGTGSSRIDWADTVYYGSGNDIVTNSWMVYDGAGDDLYVGNDTVVAGSGNDLILSSMLPSGGYWGTNTLINADMTGNVLVGGGATFNTPLPTAQIAANDYESLAPLYAQILAAPYPNNSLNSVAFGQGITPADLRFSWGQVDIAITGSPADQKSKYTTLDIAWGANNQSVRVIMPHFDEPAGSGVSMFSFADGTKFSMADMIAIAPPAPSFDPQLFQYQLGMGSVMVGPGFEGIQFGIGITPGMITLGVGSLMLRVGDNGDAIHITDFDPANALAANDIKAFKFADGTLMNYDQMLSRGFDLYGTSGNDTLTGTNLDNRIYGDGGNDTLIGSGAHDTLDGGIGNDTLVAGNGMETFVLNQGEGKDTIVYVQKNFSDTIRFGEGITVGSVFLSQQGSDLLVKYGTQGDSAFITGFSSNGPAGYYQAIANVEFADGSTGSYMADGQGNAYLFTYNNGQQVGAAYRNADGSYNSSTINADGSSSGVAYGVDGSYYTFASDAHGNMATQYYEISGNILSSNILNSYPDGGWISTNYDAIGNKLNDTWLRNDNGIWMTGDDIFNADASSSGNSRNPDGSYSSYANDGHGNVTTINYDASGRKLSDSWVKADGTYGNDIFNADGSSSGTGYDASGNKLSESWTRFDGTSGTGIFNADGSVSGTSHNPDGSYATYVRDTLGKVTTTNFSANGTELGHGIATTDGSGVVTTVNYDVNGIELGYGITVTDGNGVITTTNYDASGTMLGYKTVDPNWFGYVWTNNYDAGGNKLDATWWHASDGYYRVDNYHIDGSGSASWRYSDSTYGSSVWSADGAGSGEWCNADGSYGSYTQDAQGNYREVNYAANGNMTDDSWWCADGSSGYITFNADGSSIGASYNTDGSYSKYVNNGLGETTTHSYDSSGSLLSYSVVFDDGQGNVHTSNYDASGTLLADSWTHANSAPLAGTVADQTAVQDAVFSFRIPAGSFSDQNISDTLTYVATQSDGSTLPSWLSFDPVTQTFSGIPISQDVGSLNVLVTVTDTGGLSASSTFSLSIANANDAPTAIADVGATIEGGGAALLNAATLLANDTDPDLIHGDALHIVGVSQAVSGAAVSLMNGMVQYDTGTLFQSLGQGQITTDTFSYTVSDMAGVTSTAQVTMTVTGTNDGPVTVDDTATVQEDAALVATGNVLANDTDVDQGTVLTVANAGTPQGDYGSLVLNVDGSYSYTLDNANAAVQGLKAGQRVIETFAYQATDGITATPAAFTVAIAGSNDAPVAQGDMATIDESSLLTIQSDTLLANDTDVDIGDARMLVGVDSVSALGSSISLVDGLVVYDHGGQFNSLMAGQTLTDSFSYTMTDSAGAASSATVNITITGVNDGPLANSDGATTSEDTQQTTLTAASLLANDTDPDTGDALSIAGVDATTSLGNTVSIDAAGNLVFDIGDRYQSLAQGQTATDTFNYTITDKAGATSIAQVSMTIVGLNDAPVVVADTACVQEDIAHPATGNVLANDSDIDQGTALSVADAGFRSGNFGSLALAADGSYSYNAESTSQAVQSLGRTAQVVEHFGYTVTDGIAGASSVLDVFMNGANDAPILATPLADQNFTCNKPFSLKVPDGSFVDIDQGDTLTYSATLADGSALPDWLSFDAATRIFSGEATPKDAGFVDIRLTATDKVAATGSIAGSLSSSDVFRITVSHGNEGTGNGAGASPAGHDRNFNGGAGTAPGRPDAKGGNGYPTASAAHPQGQEQEPQGDRPSDVETHKGDISTQDSRDSGLRRTDELIRTWFEEESASERYLPFGTLDRHGAWGGQIDRRANRNISDGIPGDVSVQWARMEAQLKKHLEQTGGDYSIFVEGGSGPGLRGLFDSRSYTSTPQLGMDSTLQMKGFAGLKEGLERLGC